MAAGTQDVSRREEILYRISPEGTIVEVGGAWEPFARANDALALGERPPLGTPLLDHVDGPAVREFVGRLLEAARRTRRPIEFAYRCDSPDRRRFMRLRLEPSGDGSIAIRSWIEREEARPPVVLLDPAAARSEDFVRVCAWCRKIEIEGDWLALEDAIERRDLLAREPVPDITHTICAACDATFDARVRAEDAGR